MSDTNIHALPVGHTFDGYRILRVLGAGGFGITYLAEEVQIGRKVAIKEYLPQGYAARAIDSFSVRPVSTSAQEQFVWGLDRFRKEAATLVAFEHSNIVSVYRYFEDNGTAYLVMQYVEGKPLDALIAGAKTLAESEIEEVILPILAGLEQVHAAKFLHRDIKPANIYIRKDGRPVLLDFGAARQAFGTETKSITAIVSEGYAPFEQYEARGDQGPWTDVYAIGAVLYRCIAGQRPPAAPERVSARLRGTADPMPAARQVAAGRYSARLLEAADRALSTMPPDRPQSIGELRQLLDGSASARVTGRTAISSAGTMMTGAVKAKPRWPLAAGLVGVLAAGGAAAFFALGPSGTKKVADAPAVTAPTPTNISANPPTPPATPARPSADEVADREARKAAVDAEQELNEIRAALQQGKFERARDDLKTVQRQIEEALKKRPNQLELQRASLLARDVETELAARIAARVKELVDGAEREAPRDYPEAQRLLAEAERLDAAVTKSARGRIETARRTAEAEKERQAQIARHMSLARYHLDQARTAAVQGRYAEARRLIEPAKHWLAQATQVVASAPKPDAPPQVKEFTRDIEEFERDVGKRIAARVAELLREARALIQAGKLDDVAKRLDETAELEPASADLAAVRREHEEARKKAQIPPDPDAAERERTKGILRDPHYDGRARRGAVYFAFGSGALTPPMLQTLVRGADAARNELNAQIALLCSYDQLEAKDAAEGRKFAQDRCEAAQRAMVARGLPGPRIRTGLAPPGKGPEFRRVAFAVQSEKSAEREKPPEPAKAPDQPATPGAFPLAGRTMVLSRISAQQRAVMRIRLQFGGAGALNVDCVAEAAQGEQTACFGTRSGTGRWSLNGSTLCVSSAVLNLPGNSCYQVSGAGNQLRLAGGGLLNGTVTLQ